MTTYQYKVVKRIFVRYIEDKAQLDILRTNPDQLESALNKLGGEGWELVGMTTNDGNSESMIFKKADD